MALGTYAQTWARVLLYVPSASSLLARDWVTRAFRQVAERRRWSWLYANGQIVLPAGYSTGTVSLTQNSGTVTGSGTTFTSAMVGRQLRVGGQIYDISAYSSATSITITPVWGPPSTSAAAYSIYQCYVPMPTDFHSFISLMDPQQNWKLWTNQFETKDLDLFDSYRANTGLPYMAVFHDYTTNSGTTPGVPRYELWPHYTSTTVYALRYQYETRAVDISDSGAALPRYIRSDILLEGALAEAARWPGNPGAGLVNPYYDPIQYQTHKTEFERMVNELERQDGEIVEQDLQWAGLPYAPVPWLDAAFLQRHAV